MLMQDFAADFTYQDLPEDVLWVLRRSLLDTLGVTGKHTLNSLSLVSLRQSVT